MEADLAFLIDALSTPNTPLTRPYSAEQLQEIRDSFVSLQRLLRHNPLPVEEEPESSWRMPRSKAGGSLAGAREALEESPESSGRERKETVSEIIRGSDTFSIWSLDTDTDTYETRRSLSSDLIVTRRQTRTSTISYSTPVELVWSNSGYISQSTDSDTTITPDGHRYSLRK